MVLDRACQCPTQSHNGVLCAGVAGPERQIVLFKLVNALAQQLRGVFVPYYRHLLTLMTSHLAGSGGSGKRKRSRTSGPPAAQAYAGPDAPFLRFQAR